MKKLIYIAVVAGAGWFAFQKMRAFWTQKKIDGSAPVRYAGSLQQDVQKAEAVAHRANLKIQQAAQEVNNGLKDAESR